MSRVHVLVMVTYLWEGEEVLVDVEAGRAGIAQPERGQKI